jgi:hypothetical protein
LKPVRVKVNDKMQKGYVYWRTKPIGRDFRPVFNPDLTTERFLHLGFIECTGDQGFGDCVPNTKLIRHTSIGVKIPVLP